MSEGGPQSALVGLTRWLESEGIAYCVIGGMANVKWGRPRATLDVDVLVWVPPAAIESTVRRLSLAFECLVDDPIGFVAQNRVLPLRYATGVRLDVIFGLLPFEEEAVGRAVFVDIQGESVKFATAEDLVLMKIISNRPQDVGDVAGVLALNWAELDHAYLEPRVRELSALLDDPAILQRYRQDQS